MNTIVKKLILTLTGLVLLASNVAISWSSELKAEIKNLAWENTICDISTVRPEDINKKLIKENFKINVPESGILEKKVALGVESYSINIKSSNIMLEYGKISNLEQKLYNPQKQCFVTISKFYSPMLINFDKNQFTGEGYFYDKNNKNIRGYYKINADNVQTFKQLMKSMTTFELYNTKKITS